MKKLLYILPLLPSFSFGQTTVDGIGVLRLGKTYSEVIHDLDSVGVRYKHFDQIKEMDRMRHFPLVYGNCPLERRIVLPKYKIANVQVENLAVCFYRDTLYLITANTPNADLKEAITANYGEGKVDARKTTASCRYTYTGATFDKEGFESTTTWRDDQINCHYYFSKHFSDKCEELYLSVFELSDRKLYKRALECHMDERKLERNKVDAEKQRKYEGFK